MCRTLLLPIVLVLALVTPGAEAGKRPVAELISELKKGDAEKLKAIEEIEALGDKAADAVPALVELLSAKSEDVRLHTAMAMAKIGEPAVEPLTKALSASDSSVRFYAAWGLAFVGPRAKHATPALVKAMSDPAADVRRKAAYALGRVDPDPELVVAALVNALGDADADVRQTAGAALPKMSKVAVPALVKVLATEKVEMRNQAIRVLGEMGSAAAPAIPELKAFLFRPIAGSADPAADALAAIGAPAIPTLVAAAAEDEMQVRTLAMRSLLKIGAPSVPSFVDLLGSKHLDVKRQSAGLLGGMQVQDKSVVIALGFVTKDKDSVTRANALQSLRQMGTGAKLAEPYIVALLTDIDPNMRVNAFHALREVGVDPQPGLKKALSNPDPATRINTASLMATLNLEVPLAVPILVEGLKEKNESLKMQAAHALSLRGLQEEVVLPIFVAGLTNETPSVRRQAAESIARDGVKGKKKCVDVDPDGVTLRVDLTRSDLLLETELQRFAALVPTGEESRQTPGRRHYRVTPASIASARQQGVSLAYLKVWFAQRTGLPISSAADLLVVAPDSAPIELRRQLVLHVRGEELASGLAHWPGTRELIVARLGPAALIVEEKNVPALMDRLKELGMKVLFEG